jgi:guanylate kinase
MLLPPSFDEWMRRLDRRGRMTPHEQKRRLETAHKIFEDGLRQDYYDFVIAENLEQSSGIIDAIIKGQPNPHQGRAPGLIQQLQERLQEKLSSLDRV